jgi:hypothetical protein
MFRHNNRMEEAPSLAEIERLVETGLADMHAKFDRFHARMQRLEQEFQLRLERAAAAGRAEAERQHGWPRPR